MIDPLFHSVEFFLAIFNSLPISIQAFFFLYLLLYLIAVLFNAIYHIRS